VPRADESSIPHPHGAWYQDGGIPEEAWDALDAQQAEERELALWAAMTPAAWEAYERWEEAEEGRRQAELDRYGDPPDEWWEAWEDDDVTLTLATATGPGPGPETRTIGARAGARGTAAFATLGPESARAWDLYRDMPPVWPRPSRRRRRPGPRAPVPNQRPHPRPDQGPGPGPVPDHDPAPAPAAVPPGLDLDLPHYAKLLASGLDVATIAVAQIYSERDTGSLRVLLGGSTAVAPGLVLPFFDQGGKRGEYAVVRMMPPHLRHDGSEGKYLMPRGEGNHAYFPPLPCVATAVNTPGAMLVITEGVLKSLASAQAGVPCVGLMGLQNWQLKREDKSEPRHLIPDLEAVDWRGREVLVVADYDTARKPIVNHGAAELARVLTEHGARVRTLRLPPGPCAPGGLPEKQGLDDFLISLCHQAGSREAGEEAFRRWVADQLRPPEPPRTLVDWRSEMAEARVASLSRPGLYLDRSATGAGKSYADGPTLRVLGDTRRSLTIVPSHHVARQTAAGLGAQGISAVPFPELTRDTCQMVEQAGAIIRRGLVFQRILCPDCPYAVGCPYRTQYERASQAQHAIATHKRGELQMDSLSEGRDYISLHESPLAVLRPELRAAKGFLPVAALARAAGQACPERDREYYSTMESIARDLDDQLGGAPQTQWVRLPRPVRAPGNVDRHLWETMYADRKLRTAAAPLRLVMKAAAGEVDLVAVLVDEVPRALGKGKGNGTGGRGGESSAPVPPPPPPRPRRSVVGRWRSELPEDATVWLNDATADREELEEALGQVVPDRTPAGALARRQTVLQVPADVTQRTSPARALALLRGLLHDLPHQRVGVITHMKLVGPLQDLLGPQASRVARWGHFRGGDSRGCNSWMQECDALILLGTPRVPPEAVRSRLLRVGNVRALKLTTEGAGWGPDWWSGLTWSGRRVTVKTRHYADHAWHRAHQALVVSEVQQSLGRARAILGEGIPAYVVTTEDIGERLADHPFAPLTDAQLRVLGALQGASGSPKVATTAELARELGLGESWVRQVLGELLRAERVVNVGRKKGWAARAFGGPIPPVLPTEYVL
jgi:hypothetical protein